MKILQRKTISAFSEQGDYPSQSFPGIAVLPSGRIAVSWRSAPTKNSICGNRVLLSFSDDGGEHWSRPVIPAEPPAPEGGRFVFRAGFLSCFREKLLLTLCRVDVSHPERRFFREENSGLLDCKVMLSVSEDEGGSWSTPRLLDTAPYAKQPTPVTGPALVFPDGRIAVAFELNLPYEATTEWVHLPVLKFSRDLGKSFDFCVNPAGDPANRIFYWDQRPVVLDNDRIVDFYWTWDNVAGVYHNVSMTTSNDGGRSWSAPVDTGISGQSGYGVRLTDGRLVIPVVDRSGVPGITVRISEENGTSFTDELLVLDDARKSQTSDNENVQAAWREMTAFSLGLPAAALSPRGTVYLVWYSGAQTDATNIEMAEIQP